MTSQEEINQIIFRKKITESWIADEIGVSSQTLSYRLHRAKELGEDYYEKIKDVFIKAGYMHPIQDECSELSRKVMNLSNAIGISLARINKDVTDTIADGKVDPHERSRIKYSLHYIRKDLNESLDKLEAMV